MQQQEIKQFIKDLLNKINIPFESVECENNDNQIIFQIRTIESSKLIGNRGETIRALNHITKRAFESKEEKPRFIIDVNEYRIKKIRELEQTAKMLAERVRTLKYNVEMIPMSSYERMIVHSALTNEPHIKTESHGEGRDRRVVICYFLKKE